MTLVAQWRGPAAVRSQAAGIGVIWLRSLYRNQVGLYVLSMVMVSWVGLATVMSFTLAGNPV